MIVMSALSQKCKKEEKKHQVQQLHFCLHSMEASSERPLGTWKNNPACAKQQQLLEFVGVESKVCAK